MRSNRLFRLLFLFAFVALALGGAASVVADANIVIVNFDDPGEGFNDPTPVTPVGGNPGTTLGEQRLAVFQYAASLWGAVLDSNVPVFVGAVFDPLACSPTSGVLGAAGATFVFANFPGATLADHWYHSALADSIAGVDLNPGFIDIITFFNSRIGTDPGCLTGSDWYYGLDNEAGPGEIDLLNVVVHELAHGLGFANFANEATGTLLAGRPDVYTASSFDRTLGKTWSEMNDAERQFSATNSDNLVWNGSSATAAAPFVLGPRPSVKILNPASIAGSIEAQTAAFGPPLDAGGGTTGKVIEVDDGVGIGSDGCEPIANNVSGKIALVDRGTCAFTTKVANAQAAGAKGVIIVNNQPTGRPPMGGSDPTIVIPSVGVSQEEGDAIRTAAARNSVVKLILDDDFLAGASPEGLVRLYAPALVALGSSVSHWDTSATPNLIMEPFISRDLRSSEDLDLTPFQLQDVGWSLSP